MFDLFCLMVEYLTWYAWKFIIGVYSYKAYVCRKLLISDWFIQIRYCVTIKLIFISESAFLLGTHQFVFGFFIVWKIANFLDAHRLTKT